MIEKGKFNILREVFDELQIPLTEQQRTMRKNAAVFALMTFDPKFCSAEEQSRLGISLPAGYQGLLQTFKDVLPDIDQMFPKKHDADVATRVYSPRRGYDSFVWWAIPNILSALDISKPTTNPELVELFQKDPTGVAFIQRALSSSEEFATIQAIDSRSFRASAEASYVVIEEMEEDEVTSTPFDEIKPEGFTDTPRERSRMEEILNSFKEAHKRFIAKETKQWKRCAVFEETGLVQDENGNVVPGDMLRLQGERFACKQYIAAVNFFLDHSGDK
jgi:hypothetical protein